MKKNWWKILTVFILMYVIIAGLLVPLKSGIQSISPQSVRSGRDIDIKVSGYNTHYVEANRSMRAWLKLDDEWCMAHRFIGVSNDSEMQVSFYVPQFLPKEGKINSATLIIDNPKDGSSVLPDAVFITQDSVNVAKGKQFWMNSRDNIKQTNWAANGMTFPYRNILSETIRNTFFHVPLWFGMVLLFMVSVYFSVMFLRNYQKDSEIAKDFDLKASAFISVGVLFGILGLITGAIWAKYTWGQYWSFDVKQNMSAIAMLIYAAYFVLRNSFEDEEKKARISAVYSIFAFCAMIPLIFVIPRLTDSLHPGNGGNPGLGSGDLDNTMRMIFYPAIIGFTLLGVWIANLVYRAAILKEKMMNY